VVQRDLVGRALHTLSVLYVNSIVFSDRFSVMKTHSAVASEQKARFSTRLLKIASIPR